MSDFTGIAGNEKFAVFRAASSIRPWSAHPAPSHDISLCYPGHGIRLNPTPEIGDAGASFGGAHLC